MLGIYFAEKKSCVEGRTVVCSRAAHVYGYISQNRPLPEVDLEQEIFICDALDICGGVTTDIYVAVQLSLELFCLSYALVMTLEVGKV